MKSLHNNKRNLVIKLTILLLFQLIAPCAACPVECQCIHSGNSLTINCSNSNLTELPDGLLEFDFNTLDLSNNFFSHIPPELAQIESLEHLFLNENTISILAADALVGFNKLIGLHLRNNNITNLEHINSRTIFTSTPNLQHLYLNDNPITLLSGVDEAGMIFSKSLQKLSLSKCRINRIVGSGILTGLPNLEVLLLKNNPIQNIPDLMSAKILSLDLSNTGLGTLQPAVFAGLPELTYLDLSRNHRISLESQQGTLTVTSTSVKRINLAYCNMNDIELTGFQNLIVINLRGNMIRSLTKQSFMQNTLLETIDLSFNSIQTIDIDTFTGLKNLKVIDLSYNMIIKIERDLFKRNQVLTNINLSRNYISRFNKFHVKSLANLNMSGCEINAIDPDALYGFPDISQIDLSNNLISVFPETIYSNTLETLDLSMCRITSIRNTTFQNFPELSKIVLSGNRLTVPPRRDFFSTNSYLRELFLGDNPWRCDCNDNDFLEFYRDIMNPIRRLMDRENARCVSPDELYGKTWEAACWLQWYPSVRELSTTEKVWTFLMVSIIVFSGTLCVIMSIKRCLEGRKLTQREAERERNLEEQRDFTRQNRMRLEQEAALNAPDPRESRPPCYEDAILLPKLDGSFASLDELTVRRKQDKDDENDELPPLRHCNRCRSEEVLSMRDALHPDPNRRRTSRLTRNSTLHSTSPPPSLQGNTSGDNNSPRTHRTTLPSETVRRGSDANSTHYHATDILRLHNHLVIPDSRPPSYQLEPPATITPTRPTSTSPSTSPSRSTTTTPTSSPTQPKIIAPKHSPYSQRRPRTQQYENPDLIISYTEEPVNLTRSPNSRQSSVRFNDTDSNSDQNSINSVVVHHPRHTVESNL